MNPIFKRTRELFSLLALISIAAVTFIPAHGAGKVNRKVVIQPAFTSDAVVREWNQIAFTVIPAPPPFPATRWMAMVQVAVFEAVNAITRRYEPYLGTVSAPPGASAEAAAVMASHDVLATLFPAQSAMLDQRRDASLALIPDGQAKTDGIAVGIAAAAAIIANRAGDGSAPPAFYMPTSSRPYEWQPYAGCPAAGGVFFHWQNVKPFAIESASQFRAEPPPILDSALYAQDYHEVQAVGDVNSILRSQDRTDVARLYAATNPPSLWNGVLLQILSTRNDDITETARTMALMNMAVSDAAVAVFDSKYFYRTWRPTTAIFMGDADGNRTTTASSFTPLIATPCFPSYPSAHGSLSSAAVEVLENTYGRFGHTVVVQDAAVPGIAIEYTDLRHILDDISDARVYGGIHFRFDQVAGGRLGDAIGNFVFNYRLTRRWR